MKALVTGAGGFVGSAVVRALLDAGHCPHALVRPRSEAHNLDGLAVNRCGGDVTDPASLAAAVRGCDAVFHLAADYRLWARSPQALYDTNVDGTLNVLRAAQAAGVRRVIHTSSVAALGIRDDGLPADESTPSQLADMVGDYKRSKFLAEDAARAFAREHALDLVIVNPSTPIGPRDRRPTPTGRMVLDAAAGRMPAYVDTGLNVVHVDDVAHGHLLAFERGVRGERYILGGENLTLAQILAAIARISRRRPPRLRLPHSAVLPIAYALAGIARLTGREPAIVPDAVKMARKHMYFSSAKAACALGYRARPAIVALEDAIAWFRDNGYLPVRNARLPAFDEAGVSRRPR